MCRWIGSHQVICTYDTVINVFNLLISGTQQTEFLGSALLDIFRLVQTSDDFTLVNYHSPPSSPQHTEPATSETPSEQRESQTEEEEDENNSPKKRCFSHEQFHAGLK